MIEILNITIDIDLGFNHIMKDQTIRLWGIDTPELRGDDKIFGKKVRDYVRERILGKQIILKSYKDKKGKYGRWLGEIFIDGENLNEELVKMGYAVEFMKK
ncbi:MAG: thermonuclease family protein [Candidatus Gracilibacteria bacterium]|nr:thermonuclease family protein [Candidatus Gracilibacteria bacterium]